MDLVALGQGNTWDTCIGDAARFSAGTALELDVVVVLLLAAAGGLAEGKFHNPFVIGNLMDNAFL